MVRGWLCPHPRFSSGDSRYGAVLCADYPMAGGAAGRQPLPAALASLTCCLLSGCSSGDVVRHKGGQGPVGEAAGASRHLHL